MKTKRIVRLPNGVKVTLGAYIQAWKILKASPPDRQVNDFEMFPVDAKYALNEIRNGIHHRMNRHMPHYGKGRKWGDDWQIETYRAARQLNAQPKLAIHWLPHWLKARFSYRISEYAA